MKEETCEYTGMDIYNCQHIIEKEAQLIGMDTQLKKYKENIFELQSENAQLRERVRVLEGWQKDAVSTLGEYQLLQRLMAAVNHRSVLVEADPLFIANKALIDRAKGGVK